MTPIEIFEYKLNWKPGYTVRLHSDLRSYGKEWCKQTLEKHQWDVTDYTNVYEDTYNFEHKSDADNFRTKWPRYTDQ